MAEDRIGAELVVVLPRRVNERKALPSHSTGE
jgi:hypothetical protein